MKNELTYAQLINENYPLNVEKIQRIDSHFGTEIYLLYADQKKYIVKSLPLGYNDLEEEGHITDYLTRNDIKVAKVLRTKNGYYAIKANNVQFHVQEFVEGTTLAVNTAPDWFLQKSAQKLGKIQKVLQDYKPLRRLFDDDFFSLSSVSSKKEYLINQLHTAEADRNTAMADELKEQLNHAEKLLTFSIDTKRLTYSNSHGDYWIGQMITHDEDFTVIDWSSACCLPVCNEVIMSYAFADPSCKNGSIDACRLNEYIYQYSKYFMLNEYDRRIMPYLFYWHQFMTNYTPPFSIIPEGYKDVSRLINKLLNWLHENVDKLSAELCIQSARR